LLNIFCRWCVLRGRPLPALPLSALERQVQHRRERDALRIRHLLARPDLSDLERRMLDQMLSHVLDAAESLMEKDLRFLATLETTLLPAREKS